MTKHIQIEQDGLKCDNTVCDWKDQTVLIEDYQEWLNKPCPKCGENVLTQTDYENAKKIYDTINYINSLDLEELKKLQTELLNTANTDNDSNLSDAHKEVIDNLQEGDTVSFTIDTHKDITITNIKKDE